MGKDFFYFVIVKLNVLNKLILIGFILVSFTRSSSTSDLLDTEEKNSNVVELETSSEQTMTVKEFKESIKEELEHSESNMEMFEKSAASEPYFPAVLATYDNVNRVTIEFEGMGYYFELLADHLLYGNGYCWEGIIIQKLEENNVTLLQEVDFDSEGDTFVAYCTTKESQIELAKAIHILCSDSDSFSLFLNGLDRNRIDY